MDVTVRAQRRTGTAATLEEAVALRAQLKEQLDAGTITGRVWTLQVAIEKTYEAVWRTARSGAKLRANAEDAALFIGASTKLTEISTDIVDGYISHLKKLGNAGGTINRKLAALSKVLGFAWKRAETSGLHTTPHLERQKESEGRIRFLTPEEEAQLLAVVTGFGKQDHADAIVVLIDTGLRGSELWRLEYRDIDFKGGTLTIWQAKNTKPRSVPLTARVRAIFEARRTAHPLSLKTTPKQPFPYTNDWLESLWNRAKAKLGLSGDIQFVPYALRHTCASRLIQGFCPAFTDT